MMKKTAMMLAALAMSAAAFADMPIMPAGWILFSSEGPDRYADGTQVLDGEVYALVWSKTDANGALVTPFALSADGNAADGNHIVVARAAIAKDGRCPANYYILSATDVARHGGVYSVYLLDTRVTMLDAEGNPLVGADGAPVVKAGQRDKDGKFSCVNGYAEVGATIEVGGAAKAQAVSGGTATALPAAAKKAVVTSIVPAVEDGKVLLTVGDTLTSLTYTVREFDKLGAGATSRDLVKGVPGVASGDLRVIVDGDGEKRFYQVVRTEFVSEPAKEGEGR